MNACIKINLIDHSLMKWSDCVNFYLASGTDQAYQFSHYVVYWCEAGFLLVGLYILPDCFFFSSFKPHYLIHSLLRPVPCRWWRAGASRQTVIWPARHVREWWSSFWSTTLLTAPSVIRVVSVTCRWVMCTCNICRVTQTWKIGKWGEEMFLNACRLARAGNAMIV